MVRPCIFVSMTPDGSGYRHLDYVSETGLLQGTAIIPYPGPGNRRSLRWLLQLPWTADQTGW